MKKSKRKSAVKEEEGAGKEEVTAKEDAMIDEDYSKCAPWNAEVEVHFFDAIELYPPTGSKKSQNIQSICAHLKKVTGFDITPEQLTERLSHYWSLDENDEENEDEYQEEEEEEEEKDKKPTPPKKRQSSSSIGRRKK